MTEKEGLHQRLKQAIIWLKQNKNILQLDIAEKMNMTTVGLSRGLARCKEKNDEDFVIKFHQATGEIFSLDWLLYGTGEKFTLEETEKPNTYSIDSSSAFNAAIAAHVRIIDTLESQLAAKEKEMQSRLADKDARIQSLERTIADKEEIIRSRDARIALLERKLADINLQDISRYPFTVGAADDAHQKNVSPKI